MIMVEGSSLKREWIPLTSRRFKESDYVGI